MKINNPLVVVDMSAAIYALLPEMSRYWDDWEERKGFYDSPGQWATDRRTCYNKVLKAQLAMLLSGVWLAPYIEATEPQVILACDRKDSNQEYWRHAWLRSLELPPVKLKRRKRIFEDGDLVGKLVSEVPAKPIAYKGGRNYAQNGLQRLKETVLELLRHIPVHQFGKIGYEADDICALTVVTNTMLSQDEQRHIILAVNDSDILGLVGEKVTWFDLPRKFVPIVRSNLSEINHWWLNIKRRGVPLGKPSDIWTQKAFEGDVSDNLPKTNNGETLPVVDLLNPPEERRLWLDGEMRENMLQVLRERATMNISVERAKETLTKARVSPLFDKHLYPLGSNYV